MSHDSRDAEIQGVFNALDLNRDGHITSLELKEGMKKLHVKTTYEQLRALVKHIDKDMDGKISYHEFEFFVEHLPVINPTAVFEAFWESAQVDDAQSEYTPVRVETREGSRLLLETLWAKLYSGSIAG